MDIAGLVIAALGLLLSALRLYLTQRYARRKADSNTAGLIPDRDEVAREMSQIRRWRGSWRPLIRRPM